MRLLCLLLYPICLLLSPTFGQQTAVTSSGCPVADLQKCAEPLKARGVPLSKNLVLLLLQIPSPSQLRKSCQAYASVLPCFQARVADCGSAAQREILRQLANALRFLCSPFSALQQSQLMAHRLCIGRVLGAAQQGQCETDARQSMPASSSPVLQSCRTKCLGTKRSSVKMTCLIRTWLSEQNLCLLANMREECGRDAAAFYTQMQRQVFHTKFPLICDADVIDSEQTAKPMTGNFSSTPSPSNFVTAKKKGVKAKASRLSHVRFKLATGGSRATTTMALTTIAVPKAATSQQGLSTTATSSRAMTMTSPAPRKATSRRGEVITPGPATSLPNSAGNRTSSAAQHQKQQQTRVTAPASMAATISPAAVRKPKAANRATATLLVHSVPFVLFPPPTTLAQRKGTQQPKNQGPPRQRMFLPSRNGLMSNFWPRNSASPFGAARLFFFEVAPIEEITAQQFQLDLEGHGKSKN